MAEESRSLSDRPEDSSIASASRRNFLKKGAVAGAAAVALYVAPNMTSVTARPAYASITGATTAPRCVETKLTALDAAISDQFGFSVSVSGDTAIVGAIGNDDGGGDSGSAYIFGRNQGGPDNWGEFKKLTASDADVTDVFGASVFISGDTAIVGAWRNNDAGFFSGSAYIFRRDQGGADNWGEVEKLTASDAAAGDWFGFSVSISGDTAIVGAHFNDDPGSSGSAYIYQNCA